MFFFFYLELTEFPKIDGSDDSGDEDDELKQSHDDEHLTNSMSSISMDELSLTNKSGTSNFQQTSDYESFADCMYQSPPMITTAHARIAIPLTNTSYDNKLMRVNGEGSSLSNEQHRQRKHGVSKTTTVICKNGKTTKLNANNETPLLSHLFGTNKYQCDSNPQSNI